MLQLICKTTNQTLPSSVPSPIGHSCLVDISSCHRDGRVYIQPPLRPGLRPGVGRGLLLPGGGGVHVAGRPGAGVVTC